jgi:hypothetical protein
MIGLGLAALVITLTGWLVAVRPFSPEEAAGAQLGEGPVLASGGPEADVATDAPGAEPTDSTVVDTPSLRPISAVGQAKEMNEVLASSSFSRSGLSAAIEDAIRCEQAGLDALQGITAGRRDQLAAARALAVDALPSGEELKNTLVDALDASYDADAAFLSWARNHVSGACTGPVNDNRDYQRGLDRSRDAQKAKSRFAKAWRPIAKRHDLKAWKANEI